MKHIKERIEALLFIAGKPMSVKKIADICEAPVKDVSVAVKELFDEYASQERGIKLMRTGDVYQLATHPEAADLVQEFIKSEQTGELTKPSLETLTIIAYRGPVGKGEIEQIRGVNCSLILRNLLIKGLIEAAFDRTTKVTVYQVTMPFLEFLGVTSVEQLPDYERLHDDDRLRTLLAQNTVPLAQEEKPAEEQKTQT